MHIDKETIRRGQAITLDWLVGHLEYASPCYGQTQAELLFRRKCFNELALLLLLQQRMSCAPVQFDTIRAFVEAALDDNYLGLAARRPETLLMFCHGMALGAANGRWNAPQLRRVQHILSGNFAWGIDGSAFRFLELQVACHYAGVEARIAPAAMLAMSPLAHPPLPVHGSRNAYYALTHAEFFRFLLQQPLPADGSRLAVALKGGMARTLADRDLDLGLELVTASLLQARPLTAEARMLVETALADVFETGMVRQPVTGIAVNDFIRAVPEQAAWATNFHMMLVTALCLSVLADAPEDTCFTVSDSERAFSSRIGQGLLDLHKYRLASGVRHISGLRAEDAEQARLLDEAADFLEFNRRADGQFGCFIDELAQGERRQPGHATQSLQLINQACSDYLQSVSRPHVQ